MYELRYRKDQILKLVCFIYKNFTPSQRQDIKDTIRDLIGKYDEPVENHRLGARYISKEAFDIITNRVNTAGNWKTPGALNEFIQNTLRHEHMTPKGAIFHALELKSNEITEDFIETILNACCVNALITIGEDSQLDRIKHPDLANGFDPKKFNLFARYQKLKKQPPNQIELFPFSFGQFLTP